jgi:tol-pal system protein YbgF
MAGALFALLLAAPATAGYAQSGYGGAANSRLDELENQIQTLSRSVYRGAPPPAGMAAPAASGGADYDRLNQLEQQVRTLTGQIEQAQHTAQEAQNRLDRLQADYDSRLQQLEHGGAVAPAATTSAVAPAPAAPSAGPEVERVLGTMSSTGTPAADTPGALYESAFADVRDGRYDQAEAKFRDFLGKYPRNTLAGNAQYWMAETYYVRADYKKAAKAFAQGYQEYPKGAKAADSLLKLGLSLSKMGRKDDACLSLQQLRKEFPGESVPAARRAASEMKTIGCAA